MDDHLDDTNIGSEKVGRWTHAEGKGSGDGACPFPSYVGPGVSSRKIFEK